MFSGESKSLIRSGFIGVNGCPADSFSFGMRRNGEREMEYETSVSRSFKTPLENLMATQLVLVDIPNGLPEGGDCDRETRKGPARGAGQVSSRGRRYVPLDKWPRRPEIEQPPMRSKGLCWFVGTTRLRRSLRSIPRSASGLWTAMSPCVSVRKARNDGRMPPGSWESGSASRRHI